MSEYQIYTYPKNPRAYKAIIAGKYVGVDVTEVPNFEMGKTNKTKDFLANVNPRGKVPALTGPDGSIWESNAIARYVARLNDSGLFGSSNYEAGLVEQWIEWTRDIELPAAVWLYPIFGYAPYDKEATNRAKSDITDLLKFLNSHLSLRTFIVGERVTLADIVVSMTLYWLYENLFDNNFRKRFQNVNRWFLTCINQPNFKAVIGDFTLCEQMKQAKAQPAQSNNNNNNNNNKKKQQKKQQPKKAAAAKPAATKKAKNPLDLLPKSSFDLRLWKQKYSNMSDTRAACKWFWENIDLEGYSIWHSAYKYPEDNQVDFMTRNLVGGMIQRLDRFRDYGFGAILLLGAMPEIHIEGIWVIRGQEIPFELSDCVDYPSYTFTKLEINEDTKKKVDDFFCWEGPNIGREVLDGKTFK